MKDFLKFTVGPLLLAVCLILTCSALGLTLAAFGVVVFLHGLEAGFTFLTHPLQEPDYPKTLRTGGITGLYVGYRLWKALMHRLKVPLEVPPSPPEIKTPIEVNRTLNK